MSFLNPLGFWLAALLPVIVLFYLLKLRREERPISSTYLWRNLVRDVQANAPWQRLQRNILLLLQLLFLIALIIAIARPFVYAPGIDSRTVILIFDDSASMGASDVLPSRLEAAKAAAYDIVESLANDTRLTVISAGDKPRTRISSSTDRQSIRQAIAEIHPGSGGSDLAASLQIASAIAARQPDSQTIVFSDGHSDLENQPSIAGNVRYERFGQRPDNQAVELLSVQFAPTDRSLTAFAQVANYGAEKVERRIGFYADGALVSASDISIEPGSESAVLSSGIISTTEIIEARLLPDDGIQDFLASDDQAFAVVRESEPVRIALVGDGNLFLETALSLLPAVILDLKNPGDPIDPSTSLVIYNEVVPSPDSIPDANLFFIAPPESTSFFTITGSIDLPAPSLSNPVDPLVEDIDLSGVNILDSARITPQPWLKPLIVDSISSNPKPALLLAGEMEGRRIAVLSFSLSHSDLPLQVAFPLLISKLTAWLAPGASGIIPPSISPGSPVNLSGLFRDSAGTIQQVAVTRPDGSTAQLSIPQNGEVIFSDTSQLGIYQVSTGQDESLLFTVNMFSPAESRIAPGAPPAIAGLAPGSAAESSQSAKKEWWRWIASLALLILLAEWLIYHRATLVRIIQWVQRIPESSRSITK